MRFRLLGPMEVSDGNGRLPLGGPKQRLVLAHLVLRANRVVPADLLIDEIWSDEPPAAARATLQSYVSNLRKVLGGERLAGRPSGYLLTTSAEEIDVERFEHLVGRAGRIQDTNPAAAVRVFREALDLWQGDALADLAGEPSLWPTIERLSEMRLAAIESRARTELELGRHAELVSELEALLAAHPLRERLSAHLMLALYRSGRQDRALAVYQRLREVLAEELGVDPSPILDQLQRQILNHDPHLELRGEPLRGYRLIEQIGAGRLAIVHRALDPQADREVAIKALGARVANDQGFVRRFDSDARRVARLEHPHVVPLLDWWREPDAAYLVMRLMRGGSVGERIRAGHASRDQVLQWTEQIGSALGTAHRHGVIHGDIRAVNILLDGEANAYLGDFAIGRGDSASAEDDVRAFAALVGSLLEGATSGTTDPELAVVLQRAAGNFGDGPSSPVEIVELVRRALVAGPLPLTIDGSLVASDRNPYKGLRPFEEADAADFFGRETLVARLLERMHHGDDTRLLAVVGPSGGGKSSVVAAGLLPALRASDHGSDRWFVTTMTPGDHPFGQLERALLRVAVEAPDTLRTQVQAPNGLSEAAGRVLPPAGELLLVIDQFEELFTLVEDENVRSRFLDLLAQTVEDETARVRLIITLRADFYDRPLQHQRFGHHLAASTVAVPALTPEELESVIAAPAAGAGLRLGPGLVARMVGEMSHRAGALPLLQYALAELWERRDGDLLTLEAYESSGGVAAAVGRRAEELVAALDDAGREMARQLFLRLVELGEGTPDTARRVLRSELHAIGTELGDMPGVIDRFVRYRLLLLDRDPETRGATVELAHEALLDAWPRLRSWVDDARDDLRTQRGLSAAATGWADAGRDASFLLTGSRLEQMEQWISATHVLLTDGERELVTASLAERDRLNKEEGRRREHELALERRAMTRLRGLVAVLAIGALAAGGLSLFALAESARASREARVATARELSAASVANLEVDPERSMLLALEAIHATRSVDGSVLPEAEDALHRAVNASRLVLHVPGVGGALSWSPSGDAFVTEGPEGSGTLDIRSSIGGESVLEWPAHDVDVNDVAFSPDGSLLLSTGDDGAAVVWDAATASEVSRLQRTGEVWGPTFTAGGTLVAAVWWNEGIVRIWDPVTGQIRHLIPIESPRGAAFHPDGTALAILAASEVVIVDLPSEVVRPFTLRHEQGIAGISWSPDGQWIATAGRVPAVLIWNAATGVSEPDPRAHTGDAFAVTWSADSARLASGGSDGSAQVWDVVRGGASLLLSLSGHDTRSGLNGLALSPDGTHLMTGDVDINAVQVWDVRRTGGHEWLAHEGRFGDRGAASFTHDGLVVSTSGDGSAVLLDPKAGQAASTLGEPDANIDGEVIGDVAVSPDRQLIAVTGGPDSQALVWEVATGETLFTVRHAAAGGAISAVSWSPDGELLATGGTEGWLAIVDRSGQQVANLGEDSRSDVIALEFGPDGSRLAVVREPWTPEGPWSVAVWQLADTWASVRVLDVPALDVAFDPTGSYLATAGRLLGAHIWDLEAEEEPSTLEGQAAPLWGVAFSPDSSLLAVGSFDGPIRLWNVESRTQALMLHGHTAPVNSLEFSADGSQLVSASVDGTVRVWAMDLDDLIGLAAGKLQRLLTHEECRQYLHLEACPASE